MKSLLLIGLFTAINLPAFPQTQEDIRMVVQKCINLSELQPYYLDEPLVILDNGVVPNNLHLVRSTDTARFYSLERWFSTGIKKYLVFKEFEIDPSRSKVDYSYGPSPEGPHFEVTLKKSDDEWGVVAKKESKSKD